VFVGVDELLGRRVAVKVFHPHLTDPVLPTRQYREMRVVAALQHPHLIAVYDARIPAPLTRSAGSGQVAVHDSGPHWLVMEFVDGPSLARRLEQGPLDPAEVARVGRGIASALALVHGGGLVHRDVKPGNILLTVAGEPKLADFGIARVLHAERVTNSADVVGTAPYLSPEQARGGDVGPATDVYALGLVLLECLTGHREYPGPAVEAAVARLLRAPVVPDTLPLPWPDLLRRMTHSDPSERPGSADVAGVLTGYGPGRPPVGENPPLAVRAAAEPNTSRSPVREPNTTRPESARRPWRRRPRTLVLAAGALLGSVVVAVLLTLAGNKDQPLQTTPESGPGATTTTPSGPVTGGQPLVVVTVSDDPTDDSTVTQPPPADSEQDATATSEPNPPADNGQVVDGNGHGNGKGGNGNGGNGNGGNGNGGNGNGGNDNGGNDNGGKDNGNGNGHSGGGNGNGGGNGRGQGGSAG
jgi:serine/threonine protein kinase